MHGTCVKIILTEDYISSVGSQTLNTAHSGLFWNKVDVISGYFWYFLIVTNCCIILQQCFVNRSTVYHEKIIFKSILVSFPLS
jgi:hypothetical protein